MRPVGPICSWCYSSSRPNATARASACSRVLAFSLCLALARCSSTVMLVGGLANTSFVGLPMIEAFYGRSSIATGILIDQLGTYLVLSTLGITIAALYSHGSACASTVLRRIVSFPPLIALVLSLALMQVDYPTWLMEVLHSLGGTLAPLALVAVGLQLHLDRLRGNVSALVTGLTFKLLIGPVLVTLMYVWCLHARGQTIQITLFESAMGP